MADSFLQFSEVVANLKSDEETWLREQLTPVCVFGEQEYDEDQVPADKSACQPDWTGCRAFRDLPDYDPDSDSGAGFCWQFDTDDHRQDGWGRHLWVYSEDYADLDRVVHLVQKFLKQFRPDQCWSLTYAATCSKPRVGESSGGAAFVTADTIVWQHASDFVEQQEAAHRSAPVRPLASERRHILYDFDRRELATTRVYDSHREAADDAGQLHDVLVLPLEFEECQAGVELPFPSPAVDPAVCDCELPGYFCSGVPSILAHLEDGRLAEGDPVECCDVCQRYSTDEAALDKLIELGIAPQDVHADRD